MGRIPKSTNGGTVTVIHRIHHVRTPCKDTLPTLISHLGPLADGYGPGNCPHSRAINVKVALKLFIVTLPKLVHVCSEDLLRYKPQATSKLHGLSLRENPLHKNHNCLLCSPVTTMAAHTHHSLVPSAQGRG